MRQTVLWLALWMVVSPLPITMAYESAPVSNGAALSGKVTFKGAAPPPRVLKIGKNPEVCGKHPNATPDGNWNLYEVRAKGGLQDVVVLIGGVEKGKAFNFDGANFIAENCEFVPYVNVGVKGAPFRVENTDEISHNTHTYEIVYVEAPIPGAVRMTLLNQPLPNKGDKIDKPLTVRKGNVVKLECDQHDFMQNWIKVVDNPYYAIVGEDGSFKIDEIPPGTYKVVAWHPVLGEQEKEITFSPGGKNILNFEFSAK